MRIAQVIGVVCMAAAAGAQAQWTPSRPILVVSSASPGSSGDAALRMMAVKMGEALGQPVTVDVRRRRTTAIR